MAVSISIKATGILCRQELDLPDLLRRCKLNYGSYDPFFVLTEDYPGDVGLLYNPSRLGRGIYFDGTKRNEGEVNLCFNLPTTPSEIDDLVRLATEIKVQYRNVELTHDNITVSIDEFVESVDKYKEYSLATLRGFCETKQYESAIITLVSFPYTLTPDEMEFFSKEGGLEEFEELIHEKQMEKAIYCKPKILTEESTEEVVAFYTLAENCPSILPVEYTCFLSLEQVVVDKGLIRFYLGSESQMMDGYYDYNKFTKVMIEFGATYFDGDHLLLPELGKAEFEEITQAIKELPDEEEFFCTVST